jgi:RNA polymerase sigma-70 factor (ECF subfamily)
MAAIIRIKNYLCDYHIEEKMEIPPKDQERRVIEQLREGSKEAFHDLFEAYGPKILAFAISYLKDHADAEEMLQEVFLKLWETRSSLDPSKNIKSFLFKICINLIYDFIRKKNIKQVYVDYSLQNNSFQENNTWHEVIYNDMQNYLQLLISSMPEQRQHIYRLSKEDGLTNEEIAQQLHLSQRTVENQLYRAVLFLKNKLGTGSIPLMLFFFLQD